jgi:hypothetical protein
VTSICKASAYLRTACGVSALFAVVALAPATASAKEECWETLVADWSDGAISNLYPISCYRQALKNMPEDVRLYSSASDDINRALSGRVVGRSLAGSTADGSSQPTAAAAVADGSSGTPLVLFGSLAALLLLGGAAGFYTQRKWRGAARLRAPND